MKIIEVEDEMKTTSYFEALAKTIHGKYSSESFLVVSDIFSFHKRYEFLINKL